VYEAVGITQPSDRAEITEAKAKATVACPDGKDVFPEKGLKTFWLSDW